MLLTLVFILNFLSLDLAISVNNCTSRDYIHCGDKNDPHKCISKEWWCDGTADCESGADEAHCPAVTCLVNEFLCHSGTQCIPKLLHCDGVYDCLDKSDEKLCPKNVSKKCSSLTEFDCNNDGINCISLSKMCDGVNDCGRNEDELPGNSIANCQRNDCKLVSNGGCSHFCANFYMYIKCYCPDGYRLMADNKTCVDIDECATQPPRCSQICKNTLGGFNCHCHPGYIQTSENPGLCLAPNGDRSLLVTLGSGRLVTINFKTGSNHSAITLKHEKTWTKIDADLHGPQQTIIWNTLRNGHIGLVKTHFQKKDNGSRFMFEKSLNINDENFCTGLSFDWLRGLLFWTSASENRIYVTDIISNATIVLLNQGIKNPRSIAVNPITTTIYWVEWGMEDSSTKIEMMLMNTEDRRTLINIGLNQPQDLAIDFLDNKLYWSDINPGSISFLDLNNPTAIPKVVVSNQLLYPFSIALFENKLFWSDWRQNQIISTDKFVGDDFTVLAKLHKPYAVRVLHTLSQPLPIPSDLKLHSCLRTESNPCSHICLPYPPTKPYSGIHNKFLCRCPTGSFLARNNKSCHLEETSPDQFHYSHRQQIIVGVALSLTMIVCLSLSMICIFICRQRSWAQSNKYNNRKLFNHPIVTGDLMFIFKCNSHSSQLSELLSNDLSNASTA